MSKTKGHWPKGKRRNPEPPDWSRIVEALDMAASRRQSQLIADKIGVRRETIMRWRRGVDFPEKHCVKPMIDALYALKLYWLRAGRN